MTVSLSRGSTPRTWLPRAAFIVLAVGLAVAANFIGRSLSSTQVASAPPPLLAPAEIPQHDISGLRLLSKLDLGEVWETPSHVAPLQLQNVTPAPITIDKFDLGCECTKVIPDKLTIGPGETADVTVHLDLTHRTPGQYGIGRRQLSVQLSPNVAGKGLAARPWIIDGTILARASLAEPLLQFGDACVQNGKPLLRTAQCRVFHPGDRIDAALRPEFGTASISGIGEGIFGIAVSPNPTLAAGPFAFTVPITVIGSDGLATPGPVLKVEGEMRAAYYATPAILLMGERPVGSVVEAEFVVTAPSSAGFLIKGVAPDSPSASVAEIGGSAVTGEVRYRVRQTFAKAGNQAVKVEVTLENAERETRKLIVRVRYFGEQPASTQPK